MQFCVLFITTVFIGSTNTTQVIPGRCYVTQDECYKVGEALEREFYRPDGNDWVSPNNIAKSYCIFDETGGKK